MRLSWNHIWVCWRITSSSYLTWVPKWGPQHELLHLGQNLDELQSDRCCLRRPNTCHRMLHYQYTMIPTGCCWCHVTHHHMESGRCPNILDEIGWYITQIFSAEQLGSGSCLWRKEISQVPWRLPGGRLNKKDGLTRYGNSHVKDKTS